MYRAGIAGFLHESNSFLPSRTPYQQFAATCMVRGRELEDRWGGASHELGGMLAGARAEGMEPVPLYSTYAVPSGEIEPDAYERIADELLEAIRGAGRLDGLLLALHGATVAASHPDADGELLRRVRGLVGPDVPVVVTFDLHANLSQAMARHSTALIGYQSNPHLDQRERGLEAASLLARVLRDGVRTVQHLEMPPMVLRNSRQLTAQAPAKLLYDDMREVRSWPGILTASVAMGFLHSDVEEVGASFVAVADNDPDLARRAARWMADRAWARRSDFTGALPTVEDAVRRAGAASRTPVVLMDCGDNVGGGSAADSTVLLAEMMRQGVPDGLVVLFAPEAVARCAAAGVGAWVDLVVGDPPLAVSGRVRSITDGRFEETQVRHGGWRVCDQGLTAVVETAERHSLILTSRRMPPLSIQQVLTSGVQPELKRAIVAKGVVAPRAAYEPVAAEIVLVDTPGATTDDPAKLPYSRRRRPLYPLEIDASRE
jgi:microcystin degradation protein MlrC